MKEFFALILVGVLLTIQGALLTIHLAYMKLFKLTFGYQFIDDIDARFDKCINKIELAGGIPNELEIP